MPRCAGSPSAASPTWSTAASRNCWPASSAICASSTASAARVAIFKLDDGSEYIEAVANEELLEANRERLRDDELVIVQGKVQPDRFSGGLRLNVNQLWDLPAARARFGKYLAVAVNGRAPPVADVIRTWPAKRLATDQGVTQQGLAMRLQLERQAVQAELDLGDAARFWPSDEALARWKTLAHEGRAAVVYE